MLQGIRGLSTVAHAKPVRRVASSRGWAVGFVPTVLLAPTRRLLARHSARPVQLAPMRLLLARHPACPVRRGLLGHPWWVARQPAAAWFLATQLRRQKLL